MTMQEETTCADVLTPRLKLWNNGNKFSTITNARTSNDGEFIAVLTESRHVFVTHVKQQYEDAVYDNVRHIIWGVCNWRNEKCMEYPSADNFLVTTRIDHYINIFSISTSDNDELFRCSMVAVIEPLTLYCNESITSISQLSVICSLGNLDGSSHQIICVVNQAHLLHIVLSPPEKPYIARSLALITLNEKTGDCIKEHEYKDGVLYLMTDDLMLYLLRSSDFLLLKTINVYEKFQLIDVVQFGVSDDNGLHTVMFIESACQMHFLKLRPFEREVSQKVKYSWSQSDIWKDRLRHTKSMYKREKEQICCSKDDIVISSVPLLSWIVDFSVRQVCVSCAAVMMVQENPKDSKQRLFSRYDLSKQEFSFTEVPPDACVSLCWNTNYPLYFVSSTYIVIPTFGTTQEEMIDAILQFSDIQVAESVCKSNEWNQFSVPLHTLQVGLQHKQLDVISFFLKSRQNVFTRYWESVSDLTAEEMNSEFTNENANFNEMYSAIEMLVEAVVTNSKREHKQTFFEGLLRVTIIYLNGLIQNGIAALEIKNKVLPNDGVKDRGGEYRRNSSFSMDISSTLELISSKLIELRTFLRHPMEKEESCSEPESRSDEELSDADIELYLFNGQIPLLQKKFKQQNRNDGKLSTIITIGRGIVNRLLKDKNIVNVERILVNLGLESNEELKKIYQHEMNRELRDFLHCELRDRKLLSEQDIEDYAFVVQVEDFRNKEHQFLSKTNLNLSLPIPLSSELPLRLKPVEMETKADMPETLNTTALFSIDHAKCWDKKRKNRIVLDGVFTCLSQVSLDNELSSDLWDYLISHSSLPLLQKWIEKKKTYSEESDESFVFPDIPDQMPTNFASPEMEEQLLHLVVKNGHYPNSIVDDFNLLFPYLCKGRNVFGQVHPMVNYRRELMEGYRDELVHKFDDYMICFCQEKDLLMVLWHYVCHYKIPMSVVKVKDRIKSWLSVVLSFHDVFMSWEDSDHESLLFAVFSENAHFLSTKKSNEPYSLTDMLSSNQAIIATASLLICPYKLTFLNNKAQDGIEKELWRKSLGSYHQLYRALFSEEDHGRESYTMYQLLNSNADLDVARWFRWVSNNGVGGKEGETLSELPHFSLLSFVKKYAFEVMLDHQFYLEQFRPTFAYMVCLRNGDQFADKKVVAKNSVLADAYQAGIDNISNLPVVTSCSFFLELLDIDSEKLKIDSRVCMTISMYWDQLGKNLTEEEFRKYLIGIFLAKVNQRKLEVVLKLLEDATEIIIQENHIDNLSYDAIWCWHLAISFCRIHSLPLSMRFVENCCEAGDWLHFFVFLHFYQVPSEQVILTLENCMKNRTLREHIIAVLQSTRILPVTKSEEKQKKLKRDVSRSKLTKDKELSILMSSLQPKEDGIVHSPRTVSSSDQMAAEVRSNFKLLDASGLPDNLVDIIVACEEQDAPWRALLAHGIVLSNEMFAILAMCYSDADSIACQCIWYMSSVNTEGNNLMHQICNALLGIDICAKDVPLALQTHCWCLNDLLLVTERIAREGVVYSQVLTYGFRIFRNDDDVAVYLLQFFQEFLYGKDDDELFSLITRFQTEFEKLRNHEGSGSYIPLEDDIVFYEEFSDRIIQALASLCEEVPQVRKLVILLDNSNFGDTFSTKVPNYASIRKIVDLVYSGGIAYPLQRLFTANESMTTQHVNEIFDLLLKQASFDQASDLALLYCLPQSRITLQRVIVELEDVSRTDAWLDIFIRSAFIDKSDKFFFEQKCCCDLAATFFEQQALSKGTRYTNSEKSKLLMLAMQWYHRSIIGDKSTKISDLEKEVWRYQIKAEVELQVEANGSSITDLLQDNFDNTSDAGRSYFQRTCSDIGRLQFNDSTELIQESYEVPDEGQSTTLLSIPEECAAFERVVGKLLDSNSITEARRVASYFRKKTIDLEIVLAAISLAQGHGTVDSLSEDIKSILAATTSRHISISGLLERSGTFTPLDDVSSPVLPSGGCMKEFVFIEEVQNALEKLTLRVKYGKKCLQQVLVCFKIATMSGKSYEDVVVEDVYCVLGQVLNRGIDTRRQLSRQFIKAFDMPADEVGNFIGETMTSWIKASSGISTDSDGSTDTDVPLATYTYDQIVSLLQLTENKSQVGNVILQAVVDLSNTSQCRSAGELSCEVELLVYAHHCFSLCCDMEGIGRVLHFAGLCTKSLARLQLHSQMGRLLTGIGRFNEMVYVIETLYNQHHFEILCHQGHAKEESLKKALLDFLRKYHPKDHDNFHIVAHGFGMYREMAQHHKSVALEKMNSVIKEILRGNTNPKDYGTALKDIKKIFKYAADYYLKEECVSHAQKCMRMARLVEVQAQLPTGVCVLGLSDESVNSFLLTHKNFLESYMVADSYELSAPSCFVEPLFHNVVLDGNRSYLEQYLRCFRLSTSIASQLASLYLKEKRTEASKANMQHLLCKLHDVKTKLKLARDLSFSDMEKDLLEGCAGAYLRDNMF